MTATDHVVLAVEARTAAEVEVALNACFSPNALDEAHFRGLGITLDVSDVSVEARYAATFLERNGLEDHNPIWQTLDSAAFCVEVDVSARPGSIGASIKEVFADALARKLSALMGKRVALSIENGYVPFGIYQSGELTHDYVEAYRASFAETFWIPRSLSQSRH